MNIKTTLKASVAAAALFAVAVPVAEAGTVSNSNDMNVTVSGHFNKGIWFYDSGDASGTYQGDNGGSQSRARIVATGKMNEAVNVSGVVEWAMTASDESSLDPWSDIGGAANGTESGTDSFFTLRHSYVSINHKRLGSVAIGHTSEATDGISEIGGAGNLQYGTSMLFGGSVSLQNSATNAVANGRDLASLRVGVDGTRSSVIRYNTPSVGGVVLGVSHTNEQNTAVDAKFSGKFGGIGVTAGVGHKNLAASSTTIDSATAGGIALSHDSGLAVDFNYGQQNLVATTRDDPTAWAAGLNYAADLTSVGKTTFRVAYSKSENATANDDELIGYMVGVDQTVANGMSIYGGFQLDQAEQANNVNYEDVTTVFAGTKIVF